MTHEELKDLIRTFSESDLTHFRYDTETETISLKRIEKTAQQSIRPRVESISPISEPNPIAAPMVQSNEAVEAPLKVQEKEDSNLKEIKAPLAGVFYRAAKPGEEPYIREGKTVKKGQTIGLIEAMKLMSEIPSPVDGVVKSIEVENGVFAEFGKTLVVIEEA